MDYWRGWQRVCSPLQNYWGSLAQSAESPLKMVQGLFSRDIDPLIIDTRCMAKASATQNISYGTCEECRRKYSFLFGDIETY